MTPVKAKQKKAPQVPDNPAKVKVPEGMDLRKTRLIQRLKKPFKHKEGETPLAKLLADNPFNFGGGLVNGGLSKEAMTLLRDIWEFDYMGAAEFEYGAVPKALQEMAKVSETLKRVEMLFDFGYTKSIFEEEDVSPGKIIQHPVYIIAPESLMAYAVEIVKVQASSGYPDHKIMHLKEYSGLNRAVREAREAYNRIFGWLELDHGFFFSIDKEMADKFANLMGLKEETL